jgi:hypothetical protein
VRLRNGEAVHEHPCPRCDGDNSSRRFCEECQNDGVVTGTPSKCYLGEECEVVQAELAREAAEDAAADAIIPRPVAGSFDIGAEIGLQTAMHRQAMTALYGRGAK